MNCFFRWCLGRLYGKLDSLLPSGEENICKDCYKCCSAAARQKVSEIEKNYIRNFLKRNKLSLSLMEDYEEFLKAREELQTSEAWEVLCPFYNREKKYCNIYQARPYSCRIYGNYSLSVDDLPGGCAYRKKVKIYSEENMFRVIPYSDNYGSIAAAYKIYIKYFGKFSGK